MLAKNIKWHRNSEPLSSVSSSLTPLNAHANPPRQAADVSSNGIKPELRKAFVDLMSRFLNSI